MEVNFVRFFYKYLGRYFINMLVVVLKFDGR